MQSLKKTNKKMMSEGMTQRDKQTLLDMMHRVLPRGEDEERVWWEMYRALKRGPERAVEGP